MDLRPAPDLSSRLAALSEAERTTLAAVTVWWNLSSAASGAPSVEIDDELLLKFAAWQEFDADRIKTAVRTFVAWSASLGEGLGAGMRMEPAVERCLEACLVTVVRAGGEVFLAIHAQRCVDAFAVGSVPPVACARTVAYLLNLATDDPLGFERGVSLVFDFRAGSAILPALVDFRTVLSYIGRYPVRVGKTRVVAPSSRFAGLLGSTVGALFPSSFEFIDPEHLPELWGAAPPPTAAVPASASASAPGTTPPTEAGAESATPTPPTSTPAVSGAPNPVLAKIPVWLGGNLGEIEEKMEASAFVARRKLKEFRGEVGAASASGSAPAPTSDDGPVIEA